MEKICFKPKRIDFDRTPEGVNIVFKVEVEDLLKLWDSLLLEENLQFSLFIPQHRIIDTYMERFPHG